MKAIPLAAVTLAALTAAAFAAPKPAPELQKAIDAFAGSWTIEEDLSLIHI